MLRASGPRPRHASTPPVRRGGFVLPSALLVLVLVGGLLLDGALRFRTQRLHALNAVEAVRATTAAYAGVAHALARLDDWARSAQEAEESEGPVSRRLSLDEVVDDLTRFPLGHESYYSVRVRDAASRLSVNHASREELERVFRALGVSWDRAAFLAQGIVFRRQDGAENLGAEWRRTGSGGLSHPADAPVPIPFFSQVDLLAVPGMDPEILQVVAEYITVAGTGVVNLNSAPWAVLQALPGFTEETASSVLDRRARGEGIADLPELAAGLSAPARAALNEGFSALAGRATFATTHVEIVSVGGSPASMIQRTIHALALRRGASVQLLWMIES